MTVFPQLPLVLYLSFFQEILFPIDPLMGVAMLFVLVRILFVPTDFIFAGCRVRFRLHDDAAAHNASDGTILAT